MIVKLVAATELLDTSFGYVTQWHLNHVPTDADELSEAAGRLCYLSWDRPNPNTASNSDYLANIIRQQHFSVLEHASATFYLGGVSRSFTHELIRHRHLSFSQVSQRYVDESGAKMVRPPALDPDTGLELAKIGEAAKGLYSYLVGKLTADGLSRKEARQAARSVLPNATATQILVTGNLRAWRDVLAKRLSPGADAEFQLVAKEILKELLVLAPNSFQDMKELGDE